jgi:hypothetical protein
MPLLESPYREYEMRPTPSASAARHQPDRQLSKLMLNCGSWAGRLHAVLGRTYLEKFCPQHFIIHGVTTGLTQVNEGTYSRDDTSK